MANDEYTDTQIVDLSDSLDEDAISEMLDRTVAGKYRILRRLARGGMGVVYVAEHVTLGRKVVIKVLSYHLADDSRAKSRFEREARGLSVLDHPNVVTVHDFGIEQGLTYIVMEYVDGENLSQRVRRKGRIPYDELLPIMIQTIDAIAAAHEKGIVHRDVKPSNVMVTAKAGRTDFVKVLDFGLAKLATNSVDITKGNLVGTVSYLSPEVIKGAEALPTTDVYALGVMFYYLLAGSKPFQASDDMSVLYQHVNVNADWLGDLLPPGEAPQEFLEFIHHCMEKDPTKRPKDAMQMRQELGELVSLPSISAFSLDSSMALPRYAPPDSSAPSVRRPYRITSPGGRPSSDSAPTNERPSLDLSQGSMSRPSIALARPKQGVRVAVIAFTSFSLGLVAIVMSIRSRTDPPAAAPGVVEKPVTSPKPATAAAPAPATATFSLATTPPAQVALDGDIQGRSPISLEMEPGRHVVSATKPGYKPWTQSLVLHAGDQRQVDVFLEKTGAVNEARVEEPSGKPTPRSVNTTTSAASKAKPPSVAAQPAVTVTPSSTTGATEKPTEKPAEPTEDVPKIGKDKPRPKGLLSVDGGKSGLLPVGE